MQTISGGNNRNLQINGNNICLLVFTPQWSPSDFCFGLSCRSFRHEPLPPPLPASPVSSQISHVASCDSISSDLRGITAWRRKSQREKQGRQQREYNISEWNISEEKQKVTVSGVGAGAAAVGVGWWNAVAVSTFEEPVEKCRDNFKRASMKYTTHHQCRHRRCCCCCCCRCGSHPSLQVCSKWIGCFLLLFSDVPIKHRPMENKLLVFVVLALL